MPTVGVNPPKTPVTKGSSTMAAATLPNVCKMPGPPAPFVPTPLPNIGQSGKAPEDYSTTVKIEGQFVAVTGSKFGSTGDIASKGTGGGIISNNAEGPTTFLAPGSLDVKIEGKNVQLLGDQMFNNNGPGGNPPNAASMMGALHPPTTPPTPEETVKCVIQCCDKKAYSLPKKNRPDNKACQRLACRKHSCVCHALREKTPSGKLTKKDKFPGITASRKFTTAQVPGMCKDRIPDVVIEPDKIIDAKFPCESSMVTGSGYTKGKGKKAYPSLPKAGSEYVGDKESGDYKLIKPEVDVVTPKDTENCPCDCKKAS